MNHLLKMQKESRTDTSDNSCHHHLNPFECRAHEHRAYDEDNGPENKCLFSTQTLGTARSCDGTNGGTDIIKRGDSTDHDSAGIAHLREPWLRDDNSRHDALIIAKEPKSKATDGGDRGNEGSAPQAGMSCLVHRNCRVRRASKRARAIAVS